MPRKKQETDKKPTKAKRATVSAAQKKLILSEAKDKLRKEAEKAVAKIKTELELETQVELTEQQENVAMLLASGYDNDEVYSRTGVPLKTIVEWRTLGYFNKRLNELTIKSGVSEKQERIRNEKRLVTELFDALLGKIKNDELKNMSVKDLNEVLMKHSERLDKLVDKDDEKATVNSFTMLILNHGKNQTGKDYTSIEEFFEDEDFSYPTIDVESEEITDEQ